MSSIPATSSSWLNPGSSTSYQSINPQTPGKSVDSAVEEEIEIIISSSIDEPTPPPSNEQKLRDHWIEFNEQLGRFLTDEELQSGKTQLIRNQKASLYNLVNDFQVQKGYVKAESIVLNLGALAVLVTMKVKGDIDDHPGYFWGLLVDISLSYFISLGIGENLRQQANFMEQNAQGLPILKTTPVLFVGGKRSTFVSAEELDKFNSSLILMLTTLRIRVKQFQQCAKETHLYNILFNFSTIAILFTMKFKGYFNEHPSYFWILLINSLLSCIAQIHTGWKFSTYANSMNKVADELPVLRNA